MDIQAVIKQQVTENPVAVQGERRRRSRSAVFPPTAAQILKACGVTSYLAVGVLENADIPPGHREFSNWPTIPQTVRERRIVGGSDIMREMHEIRRAAGNARQRASSARHYQNERAGLQASLRPGLGVHIGRWPARAERR